ncbi:DNA helicase-2/ATP-dependent DNA helicase PcrA [Motilibacter peucedani]|uniref:DNA 3'-5' helicase n=1 Tax=Motilibacter peucedani TaxID=598650 RepID=A0A420XMK1_9ACTN|nr:ATP-dependent DNA helicase [Motilibacter peucedani]RKS72510.1 DNA helicase-2/ATP-dependent DNA helicase PcrA [Motilibacter peucedani]
MSRLRDPAQLRDLLGVPFSAPQLAAVAAPLEPGVVVAGAGSGKTTVMAARVVWLVGSGQVRPEQVLGLTFTNKAAAELAGRVRTALATAGLLEGEVDGLPTVSTYHAYAGSLVQEHGLRLGVEPRAALLADATRFQLAERVVRAAPGPFAGLTKQVSSIVADLLALDGELSEHLVTTEQLRAHDRALAAEVDALPKLTQKLRDVRDTAVKRIELAGLVDAYRAEKTARALLDFGDQLALAARLAEEQPAVAAAERERFAVVLLDEYQDTSVAQRRMLTGLFGAGHPVTAVGDPCQAIYGWRGASVANLDDFPRHFARRDGTPATRTSLTENRRSGSRLLELANTLAAALHLRHAVEPLVPCEARLDSGETVCALLPTYAEEVAWAADQVRAALDEGTPPGEVAVLVRARSDFAALHAALAEREVPVEVVGLGGLLALPEVADVVALLEVAVDATANAALVRLLTGPRWRIGPRDLALLGRHARELVRGLDGVVPGALEPGEGVHVALSEAVAGTDPADVVSLLDALERPGPGHSPEARVRFAAFARELADVRRSLGDPLLDVLTRVVTTTGLDVEVAASPSAVSAGRQESLAAFLDVAARFADLDGAASPTAFLGFLRAADEYDRGLDATAPSTADTVKLMTAHKSKGLEWDVVVLPDLTKDVFPSSRGRSRWPTTASVLPSPLRGDADTLPELLELTGKSLDAYVAEEKDASALEERRLGYVAVTRARRRLVASGHWWGPTQKRRRGPSEYLLTTRAHALATGGVVAAWADPPPDDGTNPLRELPASAWVWPAALEPEALARRRSAAAAVLEAMRTPVLAFDPPARDERGAAAGAAGDEPDDDEAAVVRGWARDAALLVEEARAARARRREVELPTSLTTTQVLRLAADPGALARDLARPMPRPPATGARRGTAFHAWVESLFSQQPLLDPDELPGAGDAGIDDDAALERLREAFLRTPYAERAPYAVEAPFAILLGGRMVRGRIDAVYTTDDGFEVVDWKTGRERADPLQLAVYREAWAQLQGLEPERVGAAFLYVASGVVERPDPLPGRAELEALLSSSTSAAWSETGSGTARGSDADQPDSPSPSTASNARRGRADG